MLVKREKMVRKSLTDRKRSLMLFLLVFISYSLIYMTKNCYSAAMTSIVANGIMTKSETGLIAAVFYLVYAPFQILGGVAADKYSPGKLIVIGTLGAGIANLLIYLTDNYIAMIIIWALNAVAQFGIWPAVFRIVTTQLAAAHRANSIFFINLSSTLGLIISYICGALIDYWKVNFLFSAIVLLVITASFYFIYGSLEKAMVPEHPAEPKVAEVSKAKPKVNKLALIISSGMPLLLIVQVILSLLNLGTKALVPVMLMESYESVSPSLANILNILLILAGPVGSLISMIPAVRRLSPTTTLAIFIAAILPMLVIVMFVGTLPLAFIVLALTLMMVFAGASSLSFSYISKEFARYDCVATVSGLVNCMAALGIVLANYVFAKLADIYGWGFTTRCWLIIAAISLVLTLIAIPIWRRFVKKCG